MKPTLLILAAGMGSRFGGLKQVEPVGPNGEAIIDYTVYDAVKAGFGKVVFVIRENFADEFKERFGSKLQDIIKVEYVYQELDNLPHGYVLPENREKPWGTAHAILVARDVIQEPFCALNADDYYGYNAQKVMVDFLTQSTDPAEFAMVGYKLSNTLSEHGSVSRGVCQVDENNFLQKIEERTKIFKTDGQILSVEPDGTEQQLSGNESVSMNMWGMKPLIFNILAEKFIDFLNLHINELKSELFIPTVIFEMIKENQAKVKVLKADSLWFGVTYKEDKPHVVEKLRKLINDGHYPEKLY